MFSLGKNVAVTKLVFKHWKCKNPYNCCLILMIYSFCKHTWGQLWAQTDLSESLWGILMKPWLSEYWWFGSGQIHLQIDFISQQSRSRRVHRFSSAQNKAWTQIYSISIFKQFIMFNVVFKYLSPLHQSCESSESDLVLIVFIYGHIRVCDPFFLCNILIRSLEITEQIVSVISGFMELTWWLHVCGLSDLSWIIWMCRTFSCARYSLEFYLL